ncbi:cytochrome c oxidase subunit 7C, mitochondrial-like [Hermetia illucens]|uniref:cytochrome c oxidase subunit 7C, mitochondrial-like n=1 Tax=Hermetia illucens TaxID=343691 RepID=UPI0018CC06FF|nr:cytochrome c oxidase subunit 7C, mitochondrial-like [Hermetia illucens]
MLGRTALLARQTARQMVRYSHGHGGVPGENLPFSIQNRYKLTAMFIVFFGSGLGAPFLVLRHQLLKK